MEPTVEPDWRRVGSAADPILPLVEGTYLESFPPAERREFSLTRKLIEEERRLSLWAISRAGRYVGFLTAWRFDGFSYVEHFAIERSARGGGVGSIAMRQFLSRQPAPVVLEVELPTDAMSRRRIRFYERLGFVLDQHFYLQPPYRPSDGGLEMRLMSYGPLDLERSFDRVRTLIHRQVYGQK